MRLTTNDIHSVLWLSLCFPLWVFYAEQWYHRVHHVTCEIQLIQQSEILISSHIMCAIYYRPGVCVIAIPNKKVDVITLTGVYQLLISKMSIPTCTWPDYVVYVNKIQVVFLSRYFYEYTTSLLHENRCFLFQTGSSMMSVIQRRHMTHCAADIYVKKCK